MSLAKKIYGHVDVIFLNAGIMPIAPLSALKINEWNNMIDINIKGVLNGIAAVLPEFIAQKSGHIIATSSVAGLKAYPGGAVYGATKWAVRDLMEVLRMESAQEKTNIRTATLYIRQLSILNCWGLLLINNQLKILIRFMNNMVSHQIELHQLLLLRLINQTMSMLMNLLLGQQHNLGDQVKKQR